MKKAFTAVLLAAAMALSLCGCGSIFEKEYVRVEDYIPAVQDEKLSGEKFTVRNFSSLKQAIRSMVYTGEREGSIIFDPDYDGDAAKDLGSAIWQVRTQDAMCAYCVKSIGYELTKLVSYSRAQLDISYTDFVEEGGKVIELPYSTGMDIMAAEAMAAGEKKLVVLINASRLDAEEMENLVRETYRGKPYLLPAEPSVNVNVYSGKKMQRLYEINFRYGMSSEELDEKKQELEAFRPFEEIELDELDDTQRAKLAYDYLISHCAVDSEDGGRSIYDALILGQADSEGMALGYEELCRQLQLDCQIVYGQRSWEDHCWNIIRADGIYYHVDTAWDEFFDESQSFMKSDEEFWENYRWDVSAYPACTGGEKYDGPAE
ncbi:MAG: transglutaminase domain-containing protein [Candidatus Limivicinus sp.]|jgi:hypothetical protein